MRLSVTGTETVCGRDAAIEPPWMGLRRVEVPVTECRRQPLENPPTQKHLVCEVDHKVTVDTVNPSADQSLLVSK
jgi:hypothetical protein